ncbi:MAG TPA: response regulator transcription factor [Spirochaetia bacterium]|nr:response regulator transcription factor [Spirochaetales bacterium]HRY72174.1 response regulator transcription factor [Spirochaetia bacterium]
MPQRILVVDDDPSLVKILRGYLEQAGFLVLEAGDGEAALALVRRERPDLLVLDLMLPRLGGFELTRILRSTPGLESLPVVMLTARLDEADKILGLELGADDYVTKPFNPRELVARVRAVLRRAGGAQAEPEPALLTVGPLELDLKRRSLRVAGRPVELTKTEFSILETLMANPGFTLGREELLEKALGYSYEGMGRTLDSHVRNLRRKIEADPESPRLIETMYGVGYRLNAGGRP